MQQRESHKFRARPLKFSIQKKPGLISACTNRESFPLTFEQQRLWFLEQLSGKNALHNIANRMKCKGKVELILFEQSLRLMVERQTCLRTSIQTFATQPVQRVHSEIDIDLPIIDLRGLPNHLKQQERESLENNEWNLPFTLSRAGLWRIKLIWIEEEYYQFCVTTHHIISDGWSMDVFYRDLLLIYAQLQRGEYEPLPPLAFQYGDYALWQRSKAESDQWEAHRTYWRNQLTGKLSSITLPGDYPRPTKRILQGEHYPFTFSASTVENLNCFCQQQRITLFICLIAVFAIILAQCSEETDLLFGTTFAQRSLPEVRSLMGLFANTLIMRIQSTPTLTFLELLTQVREITLGAYEHQDLPFDQIVDICKPIRRVNRNPLFQVAFVLLNLPLYCGSVAGLDIEVKETFTQTTKFDLIMYCTQQDMTLTGVVEYATDLYRQETIAIFVQHYQDLMASLLQHPESTLAAAPSIIYRLDWQKLRQTVIPRNTTEKRVIDIYRRQLRLGNVSITESFSSLGGKPEELSLLRCALLTEFEINPSFSVDIMHKSIEDVSLCILQDKVQNVDKTTLDQLLTLVKDLSEEEIAVLLKEQN